MQVTGHLDDLVPGGEALHGGGAAGLHRRHEDADVVAAGESDPHAALLLEADEPGVGPGQGML